MEILKDYNITSYEYNENYTVDIVLEPTSNSEKNWGIWIHNKNTNTKFKFAEAPLTKMPTADKVAEAIERDMEHIINDYEEEFQPSNFDDLEETEETPQISNLLDTYERTLKNCEFYEKEEDYAHLLNEIGVLRGAAYGLEENGICVHTPEHHHFIEVQNAIFEHDKSREE